LLRQARDPSSLWGNSAFTIFAFIVIIALVIVAILIIIVVISIVPAVLLPIPIVVRIVIPALFVGGAKGAVRIGRECVGSAETVVVIAAIAVAVVTGTIIGALVGVQVARTKGTVEEIVAIEAAGVAGAEADPGIVSHGRLADELLERLDAEVSDDDRQRASAGGFGLPPPKGVCRVVGMLRGSCTGSDGDQFLELKGEGSLLAQARRQRSLRHRESSFP
jgi:hypothetical protein